MEKKDTFYKRHLFEFSVGFLALSVIISYASKVFYLTVISIYFIFLLFYVRHISKKWEDTLVKISDFAFLVLLGSPALVYIFINLLDYSIKMWPGLLEIQGTKSDWISFSGSIIGGAMTLFAVVFTLQTERENRRHERVLSLLPLLEVKVKKLKTNDIYSLAQFRSLEIHNITENHAKNIRIKSADISWLKLIDGSYDTYDKLMQEDSYFLSDSIYISLLPGKSSKNIEFRFNTTENQDLESIAYVVGNKCVLCLILSYEDVLGIGKYEHEYKLILDLTFDHNRYGLNEKGNIVPYYEYNDETNEMIPA